MMNLCAALLLLIPLVLATKDDDTKKLCERCDSGKDQSACDSLTELNLAKGVNVCDDRANGTAADGEYNDDLDEGDMVLPSVSRAGIKSAGSRWPGGILYYKITPYAFTRTQLSTIQAAMKEIESKTCIRFRERTNEQYYVLIGNRKNGCFSIIGRAGRYYQPQTLNLANNCLYTIGTPAHELLHALGFFHEQSRPDRDQYVYVDYGNTYKPDQYKKMSTYYVTTSGTQYDYDSVMHYGPRGFAIDKNRPVMTPYKQGVTIGQRKGLSATDAQEVNAYYNNCA